MADNKRQVAHARWTIEIFKKYSYMPYFEILEMIEEIAADRTPQGAFRRRYSVQILLPKVGP